MHSSFNSVVLTVGKTPGGLKGEEIENQSYENIH